ncbi:hypothetical protein EAH89_30520 [Roseomonas nepalensis]|uniref:Carbohydrate binding module xylan-binding domain-containing protein n=1 Tax=Muricoccus nepalensis TaxID=1854500 RepID=A0A502EGW6_9PROT|nr:hypothetical protein EAH89_30520 [Roseomonas nepalensis]
MEVSFLNDAWGGSASTDRNLYVDGVTYNGKAVPAGTASLMSTGATSFDVPVSGPTPVNTTVGTGADTMVLKISEDAWNGHAQYTVKVDGVQVGGVLTAAASHALGQSDTLTLKGAWGAGAHKVEVSFLNDAWGGSASTDRNLYVDGVTYNGKAVASSAVSLMSSGAAQVFVPATTTAVNTTIGTGPDALVLKISEDAYQGDAQYTVKVDGVQVGGTLTAHGSHALGHSDVVTLNGNWGAGAHNVEVSFLNDAWGGSASTDRNLHVDSITYNGKAVPSSSFVIERSDTVPVSVPATTTAVNTTIGTGPDTMVLKISEDAYQGDAQYTVKVDGVQVGGTLTAHGSHALGHSDAVTLKGNWGAGAHKVEVSFLNDTWGGSASTDRNLYVDAIAYNGQTVPSSSFVIERTDTVAISMPAASLTGDAGNNTIYGNELNNVLRGLAGNDKLTGGAGNDTLVGGLGADTLEGGAGADVFRFDSLAEAGDRITDFAPGTDAIEVSVAGFGGKLTLGLDVATRFVANTTGLATAPAGTGQFVYETDTAKLWWDADGAGGAAAVTVATFAAGTTLHASDIHLIG